jgi:hypothetical protein
MDPAVVTAGTVTQFLSVVVTVGRCGLTGDYGREDDAVPGHGGDGRVVWTRRW